MNEERPNMDVEIRQKSIDELIDKAVASLASGSVFEAERMAFKALLMARQSNDFDRMVRAISPLRSARARRLENALKAKKIRIVAEPITESFKIKPGCYLVEPPQVGADARRLRLAAHQSDIPVAVLCREPLTKLKQWPVVAVGAGMTIRTRIAPPKSPTRPAMKWFIGAMEHMCDWAIQTLDPSLPLVRRIDTLIERLDCMPDCEKLHALLEDACREAVEAGEAAVSDAASRASR